MEEILETFLTNSTEVESFIERAAEVVIKILTSALIEILKIFIAISRPLYVVVISFGVVYYVLSDSYRNKRYLIGGLILAIFSELILPTLITYLNLSL